MANNALSFNVKGLKVTLTFGAIVKEKTFANKAELQAAQTVFDNAQKAVKAKKSVASLKAELFSIFGVDFNVSPKTDAKVDKPTDKSDKASTSKTESKSEAKPKGKAAKEEPKKADKKNTKKDSKSSVSGSKVATSTKTAVEPVIIATTRIQVGKTVTCMINGTKYAKMIDDKELRDKTKELVEAINKTEQSKPNAAQIKVLDRMKAELIGILSANVLKDKKEEEDLATKTKAINKQIEKVKKKEPISVETPNKDLVDTLKTKNNLSDSEAKEIEDIIEKKKKVEPKAVAAPTGRRGEH